MRKAVFEIEENPASMTITVGPKVFDRPYLRRSPEMHTYLKEQICERPSLPMKEVNAYYCEQLGPKFNRRFQAAMYHMWIGNRMSPITAGMLRLSGHAGWRHYSDALVYQANQVLPYVREAETDGLFHLIPAIVVFQASPSAIRREIGKGAWKRIAANSRTRNMRIMQVVEKCEGAEISGKDAFVRLLDVRSGMLGAMNWCSEEMMTAARLAPRSTTASLLETLHIVRDAHRMLGTVNPTWGLARIRREHDAAILANRRKTFSADDFAAPWAFADAGFEATLLTSPLTINVEGATQHHCVGSYWRDAQRGSYAVLKVEGKERATIGLTYQERGWRVDQVYGACNAAVSAKCREFAYSVAERLTYDRTSARAA